MELAKELFIYQDSKVVSKKMRKAKLQDCNLVSKVVLWDILADVIRISEAAYKDREIKESSWGARVGS